VGFENLLLGFQVALQPSNLGLAVLGITLGTVIGVLPGLGGANRVIRMTEKRAPTNDEVKAAVSASPPSPCRAIG